MKTQAAPAAAEGEGVLPVGGAGRLDSEGHEGADSGETAESVLIQRLQAGDRSAGRVLIEQHHQRIFWLLCRLVRNRSDAEELAQETFVRAFTGIGQFRGQRGMFTWLCRIATNLAISHRRRMSLRQAASLQGPVGAGASGTSDGPALELHHLVSSSEEVREPRDLERLRAVESAMAELDSDSRSVLLLRDVEDLDYQQIAAILELPLGTVKSRIHRARLALRELLRRRGVQGDEP